MRRRYCGPRGSIVTVYVDVASHGARVTHGGTVAWSGFVPPSPPALPDTMVGREVRANEIARDAITAALLAGALTDARLDTGRYGEPLIRAYRI